jgi:hypothetical protein
MADGCMGFMNAALGRRFFATFFFARFLAGMHLSFRERLADPDRRHRGELLPRTREEGNVS